MLVHSGILLSPTLYYVVLLALVFTYHGGLFTSIKTKQVLSLNVHVQRSLVTGVPTAIGGGLR